MDSTWVIPDLLLPEDPPDPITLITSPMGVRFIMAAFFCSPELMSWMALFPSWRCMYKSKASKIMAMARPVSVTMNMPPREWSVIPAKQFHIAQIRFIKTYMTQPKDDDYVAWRRVHVTWDSQCS